MSMSTTEAIAILKDAGAINAKQEDRYGETKTGWWLDGVYLGKDPRQAVSAMRGN